MLVAAHPMMVAIGRVLAWLGLATELVVPNARLAARPPGSRLTTRGTTGVPTE